MRLFGFLMSTCFIFCLGVVGARAAASALPEMGSSAEVLLTPAQQADFGALLLAQLNQRGDVVVDPLLTAWLKEISNRLQSHSSQPHQSFTLFLLRDREINAFATLGGYIAINAGLILTTDNESELSAVIAHEMAHITQHHMLRSVERAQRDQLPVLVGLLAVLAAAKQSHGPSHADATMAGISGAFGLLEQRQINYTRTQEAEADRIGIRTLAQSGNDPQAMATFFQRLEWTTRTDDSGEQAPAYLRTHPLTSTRISEAKARAEQLHAVYERAQARWLESDDASALADPLLPRHLQFSAKAALHKTADENTFAWAKERLRVLVSPNLTETIHTYEKQSNQTKGQLTPAQRYGLALARVLSHTRIDEAIALLQNLTREYPVNHWVALLLAHALDQNGQHAAATRQIETILRLSPDQAEITLSLAQILNERATKASGKYAERLLRPLFPSFKQDLTTVETYARACALAGDNDDASEAYAEVTYLQGHPEQALMQLQALLGRDVDYTTHARIEARIAALTPEVLELRRRGLLDPVTEP